VIYEQIRIGLYLRIAACMFAAALAGFIGGRLV